MVDLLALKRSACRAQGIWHGNIDGNVSVCIKLASTSGPLHQNLYKNRIGGKMPCNITDSAIYFSSLLPICSRVRQRADSYAPFPEKAVPAIEVASLPKHRRWLDTKTVGVGDS